ncbi:Flp family type IVb pilin [Marimonas sp. MJW-29]|uniref:Flp family type IVb pilin n=1 Tax=Sulfitobacter sediminis TaxID=3234186 RepID=A0ABV3RTK3_9RHOB
MTDFVLKTLVRLQSDEKGLTLVEYGIGLSIALGVALVAMTTLSGDISGAMGAASNAMPD